MHNYEESSPNEQLYKQVLKYRNTFHSKREVYLPDSPYNKVKNMVINASYELDVSSDLITLSYSAKALKDLLLLRYNYYIIETNSSPEVLRDLDEILKKGAPCDFELMQNRNQLKEIWAANKDNISSEIINFQKKLDDYSSRDGFTQKEKHDWSCQYKAIEECLSKRGEEQAIYFKLIYVYVENLVKIEDAIDLFFENHNLSKTTKLYTEPSISDIRKRFKELNDKELEQTTQDLQASIEFWRNYTSKIAAEKDNKNCAPSQKSNSILFYKTTVNWPNIFKKTENNINYQENKVLKQGFY